MSLRSEIIDAYEGVEFQEWKEEQRRTNIAFLLLRVFRKFDTTGNGAYHPPEQARNIA